MDASVESSSNETAVAGPERSRFGLLANVCALGSVLVCFGQVGIGVVLAALGLTSAEAAGSVPHVQAVLMWGLAALVVVGLARDRRQHGEPMPIGLAAFGVIVMVLTLYVHYHWMVLTFACLCVVAGVLLNQTMGIRSLYRKIKRQALELEAWNTSLLEKVAEEVGRNERLEGLRRFLSPQVAELVTSPGNERVLESHRRRIAVVFCDLRGFTRFLDSAEPEEAMELLQSYHAVLGELVEAHDGTIDHRAGDGLMVIFNDPIPVDAPVRRALEMAIAMRTRVDALLEEWRRKDHDLGFGVGIAYGYATLGLVGHEGRYDYTANGSAVNLAARLCDEAKNNEIIVSRPAYAEVEAAVTGEFVEGLVFKGFRDPMDAFNVLELDPEPARREAPSRRLPDPRLDDENA